ncbi:Peptidase, M20/M25/M40 family, partial [hydrothermal vent metagenome]
MSTKRNYTSAVSLLIIVATIYWSFSSLMPNKITDLKTPKNEFSTERALVHLKEISKKPHYIGTQNHTEVRNYIIKELEKLGLTVEIQTQTAINKKWRSGTETKNILAKIKGSEPGKALLLLSHYDSAVHSSFGASDAGSGVVTILEGVRAFLANNKQPKNDIIILIS